ncbi:hypothetical protein F2P56_033295, partial [Juglans regia]
MAEFSEFIFDMDLMDLPLVGGEFTWSNGRVWSKLDRFLVSPLWEAHYPEVSQKRLARVSSDHFPILLDCGGKMKALKQDLKKWNLEVFGHIDNQKSILLEELEELEGKELLGRASEEELLRKVTVVAELERVLLLEETSWRTQELSSSADLESHIAHYYETLLTEPATWRPKLDDLPFETIDSQLVNVLERPFVEDEIFKVISGMVKDKAPGPD